MSKPRFGRLLAVLLSFFAAGQTGAQVIASDMVEGGSQSLLSHTNAYSGAFASAGDGFEKYQRGVSASIPFAVLDDSLVSFPPDSIGIIDDNNLGEFFGIVDTQNAQNSGPVTATWEFDISGGTDLALQIDMGAMGDFESSDWFTWTYSIDGGAEQTAFASSVDEAGAHTYTLAGGAEFTLNDPMLVDGQIIDNVLRTVGTLLDGEGSVLTLTLTAVTNGGSEGIAFQNIRVRSGGLPLPVVAFDMVGSDSLNLTSHVNPWAGAFSSPGDGFEKYQRGVSPSIPFGVLDDSLVTFPPDTIGIIDDNNLDEFFGVVDTVNAQTSDPVTATWTFDISGASGLQLSIDMGAMGDFESSDWFTWTYSIDGGPVETAFSGTADESTQQTYTLAGGLVSTLNDPMAVQGTLLSNVLQTFSTTLNGSGNSLTISLTAKANGGTEAFAFQNLIISEGATPEPTPLLEIFEIQGADAASPFAGSKVETRDNVVTAVVPYGFFMQTPVYRADGNVDTSDGIFVFTDTAPSVAVGDHVDVTGTVVEFIGLTEFDDDSVITVVSTGNPLPAPVMLDGSTPSMDPASPSCAIEFECYENMLVSVANGVVTGPNQAFSTDEFAEVHITTTGARAFREPGLEFPGAGIPGIPTWDGNPEVFELDPNKLGLPNAILPAGSTFSATGILGFEWGDYELWPIELDATPAVIPVAVRERDYDEFTVGSLNLFRLFDDIDDPSDFTSQGDERNDDASITAAEYAIRRAKLADYVVNVLDAPDILAVQEVESLKVLGDLAADIAAMDAALIYTPYLEEGNDVGTIDVGFLVRDTVAVDAVTQQGKDEILAFDGSLLHDRPPLLLEARSTADGANFPVAVLVLHNRSLGGITGERVQEKRLAQAQSVASMVQDLQTNSPDIKLVVIGDLNAYEFTDGYVDVAGQVQGTVDPSMSLKSGPDLVDPDLINQTANLPVEERYSFIFRGSAQLLDHAMTSSALDMSVRGVEFGRGNADAAVRLIEDGTTPLRSSDHDGLVLYISRDLDGDGVFDSNDACPSTMIPEAVPAERLGKNRWALTDGDWQFDSNGDGKRSFSTADTAGCSCTQIIEALDLGNGHSKFGCSNGIMDRWVREVADGG